MKTNFFISAIIKQAWQLFKKKWTIIYGLFFLTLAAPLAYALLSSKLESIFLHFVFFIVYYVLQLTISMGVFKAFLALIRGQQVSLELIFSTFQDLGKYFLGILMYLGVVIAGTLLLIIPGIIWAIKYMFVPFLIIDKGVDPKEAFRLSAQMTKDVKWDIIGFYYTMIIYMYIGVLALVVGLFVTMPVATIAYIIFYNQLVKRIEAPEIRKKVQAV